MDMPILNKLTFLESSDFKGILHLYSKRVSCFYVVIKKQTVETLWQLHVVLIFKAERNNIVSNYYYYIERIIVDSLFFSMTIMIIIKLFDHTITRSLMCTLTGL